MSLPHHHVFNAIQPQIQEGVPMKKIIPLLLDHSIIKQSQAALAKKSGRNGMKIICGYIKNQTFDIFLKFVECMCKLISTDPECDKTVSPVLASILEVVKDFDETYHTEHSKTIIDIIKPYQTPGGEETTEREEEETLVVTEKVKSLSLEGGGAEAAATAVPVISSSDLNVAIVMPDLPYVTVPEQATFNSRGGRYYNSDWEFSIDVPAGAIPKDQEVTIKMGACAYGPFDIPENYHVASGFICVVANKPFLEPVNLTLEHCLVPLDDQEDSKVVILRSDHSVVSEGKLRFLPLPNTPEISPDTLSFQLRDLCILCAARKTDQSQSSDSTQSNNDQDDSKMDTSSGQDDDNTLRVKLGKKRSRSSESLGPDKNRKRMIEYAVLFFEPPLCKKTRPFIVLAFVCHKCTTAMKECQKQAERRLGLCDAQPYILEFRFGHTKYIKFSLERKRTPGWNVALKGQEWVSEDDINEYTMPLNQHDQDCLQKDVYYPPRREFEVLWSSSTPPKKSLKIEARVHNIERTYCSQDYLSYKITASAGGVCYSGCKNCRSQDKRTPGVERVNRLRERVKRDFSDSQKNLEAIEYHFAYVANEPPFVQNFRYLCRILELSDAEVDQIEYDNPWPADDDIKDRVRVANEQAYQALYKWKKMRKHTTIGDLATALASTGDTAAVDNLLKALS